MIHFFNQYIITMSRNRLDDLFFYEFHLQILDHITLEYALMQYAE